MVIFEDPVHLIKAIETFNPIFFFIKRNIEFTDIYDVHRKLHLHTDIGNFIQMRSNFHLLKRNFGEDGSGELKRHGLRYARRVILLNWN
jgi:hypothetical protein